MNEAKETIGTVTIWIDYYTELVKEAEQLNAKLDMLKIIVEHESSYQLKDRINELFGWTSDEEE